MNQSPECMSYMKRNNICSSIEQLRGVFRLNEQGQGFESESVPPRTAIHQLSANQITQRPENLCVCVLHRAIYSKSITCPSLTRGQQKGNSKTKSSQHGLTSHRRALQEWRANSLRLVIASLLALSNFHHQRKQSHAQIQTTQSDSKHMLRWHAVIRRKGKRSSGEDFTCVLKGWISAYKVHFSMNIKYINIDFFTSRGWAELTVC